MRRWWVSKKEMQQYKEKKSIEIGLYFNKEFVPNGDGVFVTYKKAYGLKTKNNKKRGHTTY
jgi:hypothetical protein